MPAGIWPEREFPLRYNSAKLLSFLEPPTTAQSSSGIAPVSLLFDKYSTLRFVRSLSPTVIVPVNLLLLR